MFARPAASRTRLFDRSCVVEARPRNAYGDRNRCSTGFHEPANSTSFSSLHVLGCSTRPSPPFLPFQPFLPFRPLSPSLPPVLPADAATHADDDALRQNSDQRRDSGIDAP